MQRNPCKHSIDWLVKRLALEKVMAEEKRLKLMEECKSNKINQPIEHCINDQIFFFIQVHISLQQVPSQKKRPCIIVTLSNKMTHQLSLHPTASLLSDRSKKDQWKRVCYLHLYGKYVHIAKVVCSEGTYLRNKSHKALLIRRYWTCHCCLLWVELDWPLIVLK